MSIDHRDKASLIGGQTASLYNEPKILHEPKTNEKSRIIKGAKNKRPKRRKIVKVNAFTHIS